MKLKLVVIDLELSKRQRRILGGAIGALVFGASAVALAGTLHVWADGDTLNAVDLNANFADLDSRLAAVESKAPPTYMESVSNTAEHGVPSGDFVYQSVSLNLTPGTWLIQGYGSVSTTLNADDVQIALWDDTDSAEIANSRSSAATTGPAGACPPAGCGSTEAVTSSVLTTTSTITMKIKVFRNGSSQAWMGASGPGVLLPLGNRLTALEIK